MSIYNRGMILAGDIGGTKTLIGLFETDVRRPTPIDVRTYSTTDYDGLPAIIEAFYTSQKVRPEVKSAAFGVAGPVLNQQAEMTNVDWRVDARTLGDSFAFEHIRLLNDLEAMAYGLLVLDAHEVKPLQPGTRRPDGNIALIAAGTGLGQALLHWVDGRYLPVASEGGHADFAARTDRELGFARFLRQRYGRAEIEHVLSGPGLVNLSDFTHADGSADTSGHASGPSDAAEVSTAALDRRCGACAEALAMFVTIYGACAGNLALTAVTTAGVYVGGGIAPRILPALEDGSFITAFLDKGAMRPLMQAIPVHVILNPEAGLLGAAAYANARLRQG
jgi:glucokinase